ncbi:MAG: copper resistance protein B [Candidatus Sphingomonas phytovorans]|nr:copper resistance protein B [Sphingomonas sp.]WEK02034.1 MAG: copper resistance protein B [Sphingomonas sp.]
MSPLLLLATASAIALAPPAAAQTMDHSSMPGMAMPAKVKPKAKPATRSGKPKAKPVSKAARKPIVPIATPDCPPEHAAMGHCTPAGSTPPAPTPTDPHAGHDMSSMPGMSRPAAPATPVATDPECPPEHAAMGHCTPASPAPAALSPASQDMASMPGMEQAAPDLGAGGTALPPGNAPAPAAPAADYADRIWGSEAMRGARDTVRREHGGATFSQIMFNLAEYQANKGRNGFRWDAEGWFGGDIDRLVVKSEGSGSFGEGVGHAEVQALYSRAVGPYFNLQAGIRHDIRPDPSRTYATIGVEGLAPYWSEVEGALFLSNKGDLLGRVEGYYDQRITQRLILQPRAEINLAAQDVPENGIGAGVSDIELGLRLRYELAREFAPYVGISWDRSLGRTADFARAAGERPSSTSFVAGVRAWF